MDINFDLYYSFYIVASVGNATKAAEQLFISQPAVTLKIKKLEEQLGVNLFVRTKKGMVLTDEGKVLLGYVKTGIESFANGENALTNLKNLDSGFIRIGASTTVSKHVLMPCLETFHAKYPNIDIQIVNNLTGKLIEELNNGNLDILFLNMPMKDSKEHKVIPVLEVQDIFVGSKKFFEVTNGKINLKDLKDYPLLFQKAPSTTRAFLNKFLKDNNVNLVPKIEVVSYNLIMDLISIGFGIGYATKEFVLDELQNGKLYEIEVTPKPPKRFIGIVLKHQSINNFSVNKLISLMTQKDI